MPNTFKANCATTAIGSFPHLDPDAAFRLITQTLPEVPCWPQLPKRGIQEEMCVQYTEGMPFFRLVPEKKRFYLGACEDVAELEHLYEKFSDNDFNSFALSPEYAAGLYVLEKHLSEFKNIKALKGQIVGPITLAANLKDEEGTAALFNATYNDAVIKLLCLKAQWQISFLSRFNLPVIIFADEPYLSCMGSAFATVSRDTIVN
ncbi:MAG: methionine synthase, partial [Candidatus Brocadiales bacterium]